MNQFKGFLPILLVVVILVGGYFFSYPQYTNLKDAQARLAVEEERNARLKESEEAIDTFLRQYRTLSEESTKANKILPFKKKDVQNVLANLDQYAQITGVSVSGIQINDSNLVNTVKTENKISFLELNMGVLGTYPSFKAFLLQLENSLRLMDITSVSVSIGDINGTSLRYNLIARVYYQN